MNRGVCWFHTRDDCADKVQIEAADPESRAPRAHRPARTELTQKDLRIGGGGWIRTNVGVRQRIYSPSPLATRAPLRPAGAPLLFTGAAHYCGSDALVNARRAASSVQIANPSAYCTPL
jgi:hypothetical protein